MAKGPKRRLGRAQKNYRGEKFIKKNRIRSENTKNQGGEVRRIREVCVVEEGKDTRGF